MSSENTLHFRLGGLEYALRGDKSPEQLQRIVDMVSQKVEEINTVAPHYSAVRTSTLAALHLAEELLDAREEARQLLEEAAVQTRVIPKRRRAPRREETGSQVGGVQDESDELVEDVLFPDHRE